MNVKKLQIFVELTQHAPIHEEVLRVHVNLDFKWSMEAVLVCLDNFDWTFKYM